MRKTTQIDETVINEDFSIRYREKITAFDDDETIIGTRYKYTNLMPADDISKEPNFIRRIANVVWSPSLIAAAVAAKQAADQERIGVHTIS